MNGLSATGYKRRLEDENEQKSSSSVYLIFRVIVLLKVGVGQGLLNTNTLVRIECQHLVQQIYSWSENVGENEGEFSTNYYYHLSHLP